jgi:hypothetical protein
VEVVVTCLKIVSQQLRGWSEKTHENASEEISFPAPYSNLRPPNYGVRFIVMLARDFH